MGISWDMPTSRISPGSVEGNRSTATSDRGLARLPSLHLCRSRWSLPSTARPGAGAWRSRSPRRSALPRLRLTSRRSKSTLASSRAQAARNICRRLVGPGRAAELILSGRVVHAEEALAIGLVEAIFSDDGFVDRVLEWVAPIAARPHHALAAAKLAILAGRDRSLADGLRLEGRLFVQCQARPEVVAREMAMLDQYRRASPDEHVEF